MKAPFHKYYRHFNTFLQKKKGLFHLFCELFGKNIIQQKKTDTKTEKKQKKKWTNRSDMV